MHIQDCHLAELLIYQQSLRRWEITISKVSTEPLRLSPKCKFFSQVTLVNIKSFKNVFKLNTAAFYLLHVQLLNNITRETKWKKVNIWPPTTWNGKYTVYFVFHSFFCWHADICCGYLEMQVKFVFPVRELKEGELSVLHLFFCSIYQPFWHSIDSICCANNMQAC